MIEDGDATRKKSEGSDFVTMESVVIVSASGECQEGVLLVAPLKQVRGRFSRLADSQ